MAKWEAALTRVPGVSSEEAARKFLASLPGHYFEEIRREEKSMAREKYWVKFSNQGPFDGPMIK